MTTFALPSTERVAYLASTHAGDRYLVGGLLVIDLRGRPLEFHCTAPVEVSRAQKILFGQSLESHLHCDCIGAALLAKLRQQPDLVLIDQRAFRALTTHTELPIALLLETPDGGPANGTARYELVNDGRNIRTIIEKLAETVDLAEPFERILDAIREANQCLSAAEGDRADAA